ncbi:MAG TPA: ATP-binding protein [Blastocatellia bacterium]|nr:ATP-binding protein [Blastocatellia bacterium]
MSPLQILKLVGFATGAALHLYIAWLIWMERMGARGRLTQTASLINVLNICLGVWFTGNLFITLHELLLTRERLTFLLRVWDLLAMTGVALLPAALLHAHVAFWASLDNYRTLTPRQVRLAGVALYLPMVFLPYAVYRIMTGPYQPFLLDMGPLLIPYSIWYAMAMWSAALLDWSIKNRLAAQATRERAFFERLAVLLVVNGAFEFYVVAVRRAGPDDYLWVAFVLASLLPIFFVAYHVYRYRLVDVAIKDSLVYAAFAVVFIAVYTYGVRRLDQFLVERFQITPGVVEVLLILGMVALASPVVRAIDRAVHRLFTREIGLYRDVVRQVATGAEGFGELAALVHYTEDVIRRGLELGSVRIMTLDSTRAESHERRLAEKMIEWEADAIDMDEDLASINGTVAYGLRRENELIGLMIITAEPHALTSEKRAVLDVLAGQVAIEVESCRLVEEKVRLERELAARERLATLGQMAAQVAHEVKNPLSAIKSIAQVMREEEALKDYERDLTLIVSEIDRLNRTVSQLLAFSRPSRAEQQPVALADLINATVALVAGEAAERGVEVKVESISDIMLTGAQAGALREALSNLVINAVQATEQGEVKIEASIESDKPILASRRAGLHDARSSSRASNSMKLILTVTDTGPGIPQEVQQRVFEPFYSTKSRGTGLGLAIVQRRAVELGGTVELISPVEDGCGTRFRLIVPFAEIANRVEQQS